MALLSSRFVVLNGVPQLDILTFEIVPYDPPVPPVVCLPPYHCTFRYLDGHTETWLATILIVNGPNVQIDGAYPEPSVSPMVYDSPSGAGLPPTRFIR
jgi:hypothetical protein